MDKVDFTFKRGGKVKAVTEKQARAFTRIGLGTYQTRDMARAPARVAVAPALAPSNPDGLDAMAEVPLRALALERGLELHHRLGLDKVRAALRALPPVAPPPPADPVSIEPEVPVFTAQPAGQAE